MIPLKDSHTLLRFPFWVFTIILLNTLIFYFELTALNPENFIHKYALILAQVNPYDLKTLLPFISSQFLHAGFIHIISNMLFLWVFGNNVEAALGFYKFPLFYLLAGVAAGLTQYVVTPQETIPMLGASGAVAGVLGAYFALFPYHKIKTLLFIFIFVTVIDIPAYILLFYWFITQVFSGAFSLSFTTGGAGGIAFLPHIGGFIFGWLLTTILIPRRSYLAHI